MAWKSEGSMTAQHKTIGRRISTKDREFEELLRRAAVNAKSQTTANLRARKRRVRAA
jgi:hypothetical protein